MEHSESFLNALRKTAGGEEAVRPLFYGELLRAKLPVLVPVDPETKLAYPQRWERENHLVIPMFTDLDSFDRYQAAHPDPKPAVVRLKTAELLDWANRLKLGLLIHVYWDRTSSQRVFVPHQDVAALAQGWEIS